MSSGAVLRLGTVWRMVATLVTAVATSAFNVATRRGERCPIRLKVGDPAPDFSLLASDGCRYRLSEVNRHGLVVIAWFPRAFTPGCARECRSLGSSRGLLGRFKVQYFGASVDTPETNQRFAASLGLDYPVLSDPDGQVARAYGVISRSGFPSRWTFYIGSDGRILDVDKNVKVATHGQDVAARLSEFSERGLVDRRIENGESGVRGVAPPPTGT